MKCPHCGHVDQSRPKFCPNCGRVNDDDLAVILSSIDWRMKHGTATQDDYRYINALREENKRLAKIVSKDIDLRTPFEIWMTRLGWALLVAIACFFVFFILPYLSFDETLFVISLAIAGGIIGVLLRISSLGSSRVVRRLAFLGALPLGGVIFVMLEVLFNPR